jgi:hypothetical protein
MKFSFIIVLLVAQLKVIAQGNIIDSLFMIGQLQFPVSGDSRIEYFIPSIVDENGEIVFDVIHGKHKILVIRSRENGYLHVGENEYPLIKGFLHHFAIGKEEQVFLKQDGLWPTESIDSLNAFVLPDFFQIYSSTRMFMRPGIGRQNLNFFIDYYVKNFNENQKNFLVLNKKISVNNIQTNDPVLEFEFEGSPLTNFDGWIGTGRNDLEMSNIKFWNHENPNLYKRTLKIWTGNETHNVQQTDAIIGFRDLKFKENSLFVNEKKVRLKSYLIYDFKPGLTDSLILSLKKMHFNCLILGEKVPEKVFELCDRLGIYTIQVVNDANFNSIYDWFDYHIQIKEHPSFIGWLDSGTDKRLLKIVEDIDDHRIQFNNHIFPVFTDFEGIEKNETEQILGSLQPIKFFYNGTSNGLEIQFTEHADFIENLQLVITSTNEDAELAYYDEVPLIDPIKDKTLVINLNDRHLPKTEGQFEIRFELVFKEDRGIYSAGELFAIYKLSIQNLGNMYKTADISPCITDQYTINEME